MTTDTDIQFTPDTENGSLQHSSGTTLWDEALTYGDITLDRRGHAVTGVNVHALIHQFWEDDRKVRRITLPVTVRGHGNSDMQVVGTEQRVISQRFRLPLRGGCNSVCLVGNRRGQKLGAETLLGTYMFNADPTRMSGRNTFARMALRQGDTLQFALQKSSTRSFHLVYRVDGIVPVPADNAKLHPAESDPITESLVGLNLSLVAVYDLNALTGPSRYVFPKFEQQDRDPTVIHRTLRAFVDYAAQVLRKRTTPGYYANFLQLQYKDTRYDFFGEANDITQTVMTDNKSFLTKVRETALEVFRARNEAREESSPRVPRHVACGLEHVYDESTGAISVTVTFPSVNGVRTFITTVITEIPSDWDGEPIISRRCKSFDDLVKRIQTSKTPVRAKCLYGL